MGLSMNSELQPFECFSIWPDSVRLTENCRMFEREGALGMIQFSLLIFLIRTPTQRKSVEAYDLLKVTAAQ